MPLQVVQEVWGVSTFSKTCKQSGARRRMGGGKAVNEVDAVETQVPPNDPAGWAGRGVCVGVKASRTE